MAATNPKPRRALIEKVLDDAITDDEMDRLMETRGSEIDALLQEAYDAKARGEFAPLEPLHVLLSEERARFFASKR